MKRMRQWGVLAAAAIFSTVATARADVLDYVPSGAPLVLKINNLKSTSDQIAAMATKWGVANMVPAAANPLASLKQQANITNGLDEAGDLAIVITTLDESKREQPLLILAPVSDYKAFVGNFKGATTEGAISQVQFPNDPNPSYITQWGKYAAISNSKATLSAKPEGLKENGPAAKELGDKNLVLLVNMKAVRAQVLPMIQQNRQEIVNKITDQMSAQPEKQKYIPVAQAVANRAIDIAESFLNNCDAATLGLSFSADGLGGTEIVQFKPDSEWAKNVAKVKQTDKPLVSGLPIGKYLVFGGNINSPELLSDLLNKAVGPVHDELAKLGDQGQAAIQYIDALEKILKNVQGGAFGVVAPANPAQGSLLQAIGLAQGNAQAILEANQTFAQISQKLTPNQKTTYVPNAKTVAGVQFNELRTQMVPAGGQAAPGAAQAQQFMNFIYGGNEMVQYVGKVDDQHVLNVSGLDDQMITKAVGAAKADESHLTQAKPVQTVAKQVPSKRFFEMYIPLDNVITTAADVASKRANFPVRVNVAPDLQPIAVTGSIDQNAIRFDGYVPAELVQNLISAGMQAMGQVMAGPRQGGNQPAPNHMP